MMKNYSAAEIADPQNAKLLNELAHFLAFAMSEDYCSRWLFQNHSREAYVAVLPSYMRILIQVCLVAKATFKVITKDELPPATQDKVSDIMAAKQPDVQVPSDESIRALAIVIPPHGNAAFDSLPKQVFAGGWSIPFKCGPRMTWRLLDEFLPSMDKMHHTMFPDPSTKYHNWHLLYLAVHPVTRGQGLGEKILRDIQQDVRQFNESEAQKTQGTPQQKSLVAPLYLEASNHINKRLYNRVGFQDKTEMVFGKLADDENLSVAKDGKVIGGKQYGMVWTP